MGRYSDLSRLWTYVGRRIQPIWIWLHPVSVASAGAR
jgi:hypothetical protein